MPKSRYLSEDQFAPVPLALLKDPEADAYRISAYAAIRSFADFGSDGGASVGDASLAKRAGMSERKLRACRGWLKARGWITWQTHKIPLGLMNVYTIRMRPARSVEKLLRKAGGAA